MKNLKDLAKRTGIPQEVLEASAQNEAVKAFWDPRLQPIAIPLCASAYFKPHELRFLVNVLGDFTYPEVYADLAASEKYDEICQTLTKDEVSDARHTLERLGIIKKNDKPTPGKEYYFKVDYGTLNVLCNIMDDIDELDQKFFRGYIGLKPIRKITHGDVASFVEFMQKGKEL